MVTFHGVFGLKYYYIEIDGRLRNMLLCMDSTIRHFNLELVFTG